jgi:drug/metabolite transporter (DMT)-like permease
MRLSTRKKEEMALPGELTAILAAICYALSFVLLHMGQSEDDLPDHGLLPVLVVSGLTFLFVLSIGYLFRGGPDLATLLHYPSTKYAFLAGLIGTLFGRFALYTSIERLGATRGVVIKTLSPFMTLTLAVIFLGEEFKVDYTLGLLLLLIGIIVLFMEHIWFPTRNHPPSYFMVSVLIALAAANLQGIGHLFRKLSTTANVTPIWLSTVDICTAAIGYLFLLLITGKLPSVLKAYSRHLNLNIVTAGLLSAAGVILFFHSVSKIDVSEVSVIIGAEPIFVALISAVISPKLERLTIWTMLSTLFVACGVIIISL